MDTWRQLCRSAFNGDAAADHLILYLEGCGKLLPNGLFSVTTTTLSDLDRACLESIAFVPSSNQDSEWTLPGDQWQYYVEARRAERAQWHEIQHEQLRTDLYTQFEAVQPLTGLNDQHRLALVGAFCKRFSADPGAIPFLRGLVGLCRFQLFKDRLADWRCLEHVFTQNGPEAMLEYIKLLKGILQLELILTADNDGRTVILDMQASSGPSDPVLLWRMNSQFSDHFLSDMLAILPREQTIQGLSLSDIPRPVQISVSIGFYHPQLLLQWILHLFRHCMGLIARTGRR